MTCPERAAFRITGRTARVGVHRTDEEARRQLLIHLLGRQLLEVARVEAGRVVDEHVDAAEPFDSRLHGCRGIGGAGHVQLDGEEIARRSQGLRHAAGISARRDDRVSGGQGGLREWTPIPRPAPVMNQIFF